MAIEDAMDIIQKKESFECLPGGCNEKDVETIESALAISFPDSYRLFVLAYGYVCWFGHSILGYSPNDACYDTVAQTNKMRKVPLPKHFSRIPVEGNVVMKYGGGGNYFLFARGTSREGQVALLSDDYGGNETEHWKTFDAFVSSFANL